MNLSISTLFINLDKCDIKFLILNLKFCYFFLFLHCLYLLKKAKEKKEKKKSTILKNVNIRGQNLGLDCGIKHI